ncbi:MAG TPA: winged helix-turn-helix domain-containing protein [Candidatus Aquabacterium excrementipullorum]|nr:winged helix-turn-helix domain-containing protein [Candidatus Aquabacterium excrementipullorum]
MEADRPFHLYIADADPTLRDMLSNYLEKQGLTVTSISSVDDLLHRTRHLRPDLIVLEAGLSGISGAQACELLQSEGFRVPVVLLAATEQEAQRLKDETSADDCLGKPFSVRELLSHVQDVLRRASFVPGTPMDTRRQVPIGDYTFVVSARVLRRGQSVRVLSSVEYALLTELTSNPGVALTREQLLAASHTRKDAVMLRTIDASIMRLRKVVEPEPAFPRYIQTVRGHGYMFVPQEHEHWQADNATNHAGGAALVS